jgi:Tol biopolymer transport system component
MLALAAALLVASPLAPAAQSTDEMLLRTAIELADAKGDVKGAVELLKKLSSSTDPKVAAAAREHLARLQDPARGSAANSQASVFSSEVVTSNTTAGLASRRPLPSGNTLALRPSGTAQRRQTSIVLLEARSGAEREIARVNGTIRDGDFEVAPGGRHVAAIAGVRLTAAGGETRSYEELVVVAVEAGAKPLLQATWWTDAPGEAMPYRPLLQWSPDGSRLPYLAPDPGAGEFVVRLLHVTSGRVQPFTVRTDGPPDFRWSPTGTELAVRVSRATVGVDEIQIVSIPGGDVRSLALPATAPSASARVRLGEWTSMHGLVVMIPTSPLSSDVWIADAAGKGARKICSGGPVQPGTARRDNSLRSGTWDECLERTPDGGTQIVWLRQSRRHVLRRTETGQDQPLTRGSGEEHAAHLSPDGRFVVFVANREGWWGLYAALLDRAPMADPVLIARLDGIPAGLSLQWADDALRGQLSFYETNIHRIPMDPATGRSAGTLERLTQDAPSNRAPAISPDGSRIAYWSNGRRFGLTLMDADGANERQLSDQPFVGWHAPPVWRALDEVLSEIHEPGPAPRLTTGYRWMNVAIGTAQPVALPLVDFPGGLDQARGWSVRPARQDFVYVAGGAQEASQQIRVHSLADGRERVIATFADGGVHAFLPVPQGDQIAFSRYRAAGKCPCELGVLTIADQQRRVLETTPNPSMPVAWSPDGRFLLYGAARPRVINTTTGESWALLDAAPPVTWLQEGSWSPDGTFVVLTLAANRAETRRWTNVTTAAVERVASGQGGVR